MRPSKPLPKRFQARPHQVDKVVWERLWSACGRKIPYETLQDARDDAERQGFGLVPYLCPSGDGHWHLTTRREPHA